jgi:signal transduction histidine kinase
VAKHAQAQVVKVELAADASGVRIAVRDDGVGGADASGSSGLLGIADRVEALGGSLTLVSPRGVGTSLIANLPLSRVQSTLI